MRLRLEEIQGQPRVGFDRNDGLFNIRTILSAEYRGDRIRVGAELFDSRVYGGDPGTPISTNEVNALELVQAYVAGDIDVPQGPGSRLSLTAGRMTLNLGSRRLVAADDYRNTTNGYTGLRADLSAPRGVKALCRNNGGPMTGMASEAIGSGSIMRVSTSSFGAGWSAGKRPSVPPWRNSAISIWGSARRRAARRGIGRSTHSVGG